MEEGLRANRWGGERLINGGPSRESDQDDNVYRDAEVLMEVLPGMLSEGEALEILRRHEGNVTAALNHLLVASDVLVTTEGVDSPAEGSLKY